MNPALQSGASVALVLFSFSLLAFWPCAQEPRIHVEVNLVNLLVSVVDKNGRLVLDFPKEAFEVYEEGVKQNVALFEAETNQPLDLALMVDSSLSALKELRFEREAAAHFIRQVVRPGDRLAVFQFSDTVTQLAGFSSDVPALQAAVRRIEPGAGTSLYDAIYLGGQALEKRPADRRRVIVLVTDAGETTSSTNFEDTRRAALRSEAMLYTIVVRPVKSESGRNTAGEHALVTITDATGGAMYFPDSIEELDSIFDRIDRELRTQYRLGYYPMPKPPARSFRHVQVRVTAPPCSGSNAAGGCVVRYRMGYFITGPTE